MPKTYLCTSLYMDKVTSVGAAAHQVLTVEKKPCRWISVCSEMLRLLPYMSTHALMSVPGMFC